MCAFRPEYTHIYVNSWAASTAMRGFRDSRGNLNGTAENELKVLLFLPQCFRLLSVYILCAMECFTSSLLITGDTIVAMVSPPLTPQLNAAIATHRLLVFLCRQLLAEVELSFYATGSNGHG